MFTLSEYFNGKFLFYQEAAQPLADESFTLTSKSEHYTAWSGVSTLIKHQLITKWSNPAKFDITDKGMELAARMLAVERGDVASTRRWAFSL